MYALYEKSKNPKSATFTYLKSTPLFGCRTGLIVRLFKKQIPDEDNFPFKWHINMESTLNSEEKYRNQTVIIDLKPKQKDKYLSLFEILDIWGITYNTWTPILLKLRGLFVDHDPSIVNRNNFTLKHDVRYEPIYEFMYLSGSFEGGELKGKWTAPPTSPTNGALLWPESVKYFISCIKESSPELLNI